MEADDLTEILPPLLQSLETLGFVARHFNPPDFAEVMEAVGRPEEPLLGVHAKLLAWPDRLIHVAKALDDACAETLSAFGKLRGALEEPGDLRKVFRALRHFPLAQAALYPLAGDLPPVSRFFLEPAARGDADLLARLSRPGEDTGVIEVRGQAGTHADFSLYVPETYDPDVAAPLVMALHGGGGDGRGFLWSWLRDARAHGAILVAPTALGATWALSGPDPDTPSLARILEMVSARWNVDPTRVLLTGMSDGGTFCYVSGLEPNSPFTHLAPVAASFHPMLAQMADRDRIRGLPIHLAHGTLDWMFPVDVARQAHQALTLAGASVTYVEIPNLSHTYPRELNPAILEWLNRTS